MLPRFLKYKKAVFIAEIAGRYRVEKFKTAIYFEGNINSDKLIKKAKDKLVNQGYYPLSIELVSAK